jgi:hypothetical protein
MQLGRKLGFNSFVNITYLHDPGKDKYYLIEADLRPNSWMAYGRFIGRDFSESVKRIVIGDYNTGYKDAPMKKPFTEVALFHKEVMRALWQHDIKGILRWIINYKGYWRYLPFYDRKLTKKIFAEFGEIFKKKWEKLGAGKTRK